MESIKVTLTDANQHREKVNKEIRKRKRERSNDGSGPPNKKFRKNNKDNKKD